MGDPLIGKEQNIDIVKHIRVFYPLHNFIFFLIEEDAEYMTDTFTRDRVYPLDYMPCTFFRRSNYWQKYSDSCRW